MASSAPGNRRRKPKAIPTVQRAADRTVSRLRPEKRETAIIGPVGRHLLVQQAEDDGRDQTVLHPSEIVKDDWCHRESFYKLTRVEPTDVEDMPSKELELIFAEGHSVHDKWQLWLWRMGELRGIFACIVEDCGWRAMAKAPTECPNCGAPAFDNFGVLFLRYREVPVFSGKYLIGGHADGLIDEPLEIKTIGPGTIRVEAPRLFNQYQKGELSLEQMWREIRRPFITHIRQGMLYVKLINEDDKYPPVSMMRYIYENKANQAVKEFEVKLDEVHIEDVLEGALDVKYAVEKNRVPRRPRWADEENKKCKGCPYRTLCWRSDGEAKAERAANVEGPRRVRRRLRPA